MTEPKKKLKKDNAILQRRVQKLQQKLKNIQKRDAVLKGRLCTLRNACSDFRDKGENGEKGSGFAGLIASSLQDVIKGRFPQSTGEL